MPKATARHSTATRRENFARKTRKAPTITTRTWYDGRTPVALVIFKNGLFSTWIDLARL